MFGPKLKWLWVSTTPHRDTRHSFYLQLHHNRRRAIGIVCGPFIEQLTCSFKFHRAKDDDVLAEQVEIHNIS